jgi:hypothetical protein
MDVTIAVEAVNNARGPLEEAAAQLEQLEGAIRRAGEAGTNAGGFADLFGGPGSGLSLPSFEQEGGDGAMSEAHALLAEAAMNAALALQSEAMGHAEVNLLMGEGLAARQQLIETMVILQGQTLTYQMGLISAAIAGKQLGVSIQAAAQVGVPKMMALNASVRAVIASFAAASHEARQLRKVILSMRNISVRARIDVSGIDGEAAGGGDFITSGPALLMVGDNPGGRERVTVEPLSGRGVTRVNPGSGLVRAAGGIGGGGASSPVMRIVVPVMLDGVEVGRGAVEGTLEALQQRGVIEEAISG